MEPRLWANERGICWLVGDAVECCGEGELDGFQRSDPVGLWMTYASLCASDVNGGGECLLQHGTRGDRLPLPSGLVARAAVVGGGFLCALTSAGAVECRHLSDDTWSVTLPHVDAIEGSMRYAFALSSGDIWCWGEDPGDFCVGTAPRKVTDVGDIVDIAADVVGHVCGVRRGGEVLCWGGPIAAEHMTFRGWKDEEEQASNVARRIEGIRPVAWVRRVGLAAFCGGGNEPDDTLQCWGVGGAPLIGLGPGEAVADEPWTFFRGREVRFEAEVVDVAGSETIGCYVGLRGQRTCITAAESLGEACGARLLPDPAKTVWDVPRRPPHLPGY